MPPTRSGIRRLIRSYSVSKFPKWGAFLPLCNDMRERRVSRSYIAPSYDADSDDPAQGYRHDHAHRSDLIPRGLPIRSEEHTTEPPSLKRISYAVFCLNKKKQTTMTIQYG